MRRSGATDGNGIVRGVGSTEHSLKWVSNGSPLEARFFTQILVQYKE